MTRPLDARCFALALWFLGITACSAGASGGGSGGAAPGSGGASLTGGASGSGGRAATGGTGATPGGGGSGGAGSGGAGAPDAGAGDAADAAPDVRADAAPDAPLDAPADVVPDARADVVRDVAPPAPDGGAAPDARDGGSAATDGAVAFTPWPGANMVATADDEDVFGTDLSGLVYQPAAAAAPAVLWAVNNGSGKLYRLGWNGTIFAPLTTDGWRAGKALRYPGGAGQPDAEGVTMAEWSDGAVYVVAERDNDDAGTSRLSILRYLPAGTGTTLTATHEWNLTADLPEVDSNKGLEGIAWVPDTFLVAGGFVDESAGKTYAPADHPNHGTGVFFVGLESDSKIYGYTLDHTAKTFRRVATFASGQAGVMDLFFDRDVGTLWSWCDEVCDNGAVLLDLDQDAASPTRGRFRPRRAFNRPGTLGNDGHEGIAIAPESECAAASGGGPRKAFIWADDSNTDQHALRRDQIPCGRLY